MPAGAWTQHPAVRCRAGCPPIPTLPRFRDRGVQQAAASHQVPSGLNANPAGNCAAIVSVASPLFTPTFISCTASSQYLAQNAYVHAEQGPCVVYSSSAGIRAIQQLHGSKNIAYIINETMASGIYAGGSKADRSGRAYTERARARLPGDHPTVPIAFPPLLNPAQHTLLAKFMLIKVRFQ